MSDPIAPESISTMCPVHEQMDGAILAVGGKLARQGSMEASEATKGSRPAEDRSFLPSLDEGTQIFLPSLPSFDEGTQIVNWCLRTAHDGSLGS
jgi:hypothetical protein